MSNKENKIFDEVLANNINQLCKTIHETAIEKGWWSQPRSAPEIHMLIVTEVAEATEAARNGVEQRFVESGKPEGEAVELADAIIRIFDYFGHKGWDLEEILQAKIAYNKTRAHRHGGKKF